MKTTRVTATMLHADYSEVDGTVELASSKVTVGGTTETPSGVQHTEAGTVIRFPFVRCSNKLLVD